MKHGVFCLTILMLVFTVVSAWGEVSEIFVLGDTTTPPKGYTYTEMTMHSSDKWTAKANMPTARSLLAVVEVNNKIYAIGGYGIGYSDVLNTNEEYDPVTNTWTTKANMPTARGELAAAAVNGKIYAIGGATNIGLTGANEAYNPTTNTWTAKANMLTPRDYLAAAAVNGKIYAIGGYEDLATAGYESNANEVYDPAVNTWAVKKKMPTARIALAAAAVNGKIYAIGGWKDWFWDPHLNQTEEYNPVTNTWSVKLNMHNARCDHAVAVVNGKIYAIGGEGLNSDFMTITEEYDPVTSTWTEKADLRTARTGLAAATVNGKIYAIGGSSKRTNEEYSPSVLFYIHKTN